MLINSFRVVLQLAQKDILCMVIAFRFMHSCWDVRGSHNTYSLENRACNATEAALVALNWNDNGKDRNLHTDDYGTHCGKHFELVVVCILLETSVEERRTVKKPHSICGLMNKNEYRKVPCVWLWIQYTHRMFIHWWPYVSHSEWIRLLPRMQWFDGKLFCSIVEFFIINLHK